MEVEVHEAKVKVDLVVKAIMVVIAEAHLALRPAAAEVPEGLA